MKTKFTWTKTYEQKDYIRYDCAEKPIATDTLCVKQHRKDYNTPVTEQDIIDLIPIIEAQYE